MSGIFFNGVRSSGDTGSRTVRNESATLQSPATPGWLGDACPRSPSSEPAASSSPATCSATSSRSPSCADAEIALHDIDAERLETAEALARWSARRSALRPRSTASLDRRAALDGADYVINTIQVGGHAATVRDFEVPRRYGLRQTIGDTLGIGGIFRALRTIPVMLGIGRDMAEVCPDAWLLNYTNPMAMICWADLRGHAAPARSSASATRCRTPRGSWPSSSACRRRGHVPRRRHQPPGVLPAPRARRRETSTRCSTRRSRATPKLRRPRARRDVPAPRLLPHRVERALRRVRALVHAPRRRDRAAAHPASASTCGAARRTSASTTEVQARSSPPGEPLRGRAQLEYASLIIHSMETGEPRVVYGNVRNTGLITNLPPAPASRCRAWSTRPACSPTHVGALPPQCAALNRTFLNVGRADRAGRARRAAATTCTTRRCSTRTPRRRCRWTRSTRWWTSCWRRTGRLLPALR